MGDGDGAGDVGADFVEMIEGFPFVVDPGAELCEPAEFGFVGQGAADAAGEDDFALAIELVVAKAAVLEGFVDFGGEEAGAEVGVGPAAGDGGFFATLEDLEDVSDEVAVEEILERRRDEVVLKHWDSEKGRLKPAPQMFEKSGTKKATRRWPWACVI